jgi:hypothetical protein
MHGSREKAEKSLRLAIGFAAGNQSGYCNGNLLYGPTGQDVIHFMNAV